VKSGKTSVTALQFVSKVLFWSLVKIRWRCEEDLFHCFTFGWRKLAAGPSVSVAS